MRSTSYASLVAASFVASSRAATPLYKNVVNIPNYGKVQGVAALNSSVSEHVSNWDQISFFGGIPFAQDTSGDNRWREPQPVAPWNNTLDASSFGPICPTGISQLDAYSPSEDCLSINIWTPATSSNESLPVAVWSYGDGTAPPQTTYNGAGVAAKGIIFVSYNFRPGVFGFLASPELPYEGHNGSGNWGMLDQFAAFKWVHENIAAFGGDPNHISAIGQSFGAASTYHVVNSNLTSDYGIVNAISESGVRSPYDPEVVHFECEYINQTYAETLGAAAIASFNVSSIAEARALDYETLLASSAAGNIHVPILDDYTIPAKYVDTLIDGAGNKVPYITGNNADEDGASSDTTTTVSAYTEWLTSQYGDFADRFLALYPASNDSQASASENNLVRDQFRVSSWQYMNGFSASSNDVNTYTYYWTYGPASNGGLAAHASEVVYVLGNLWAQTGNNYTDEDYYISNVMSSYWANFIKTGNPNTGDSYNNGTLPTTWEANSKTKNETIQLGATYETIPLADADKIDLILEYFAAQTAV